MLSIMCVASCVLFLVLKSLALSIRFHHLNSTLLKVFYINDHVILVYIEPGHTKELQRRTLHH